MNTLVAKAGARCAAGMGSLLLMSCVSIGVAQSAAPALPPPQPMPLQTEPELLSFPDLVEQGKALLEKARAGSGSVGITLARYRGHYTMLTARTASGGAEVHKHFADFLFVLAGSGTELTGGTVVDAKEKPNGEVSGTRLEGAVARTLQKGDVIHIPAGTPHQAIEAPGQSITIYVVKVEEPATGDGTFMAKPEPAKK
jgi:mannose-6-phosphate isomerase-like protein (cupin superfamily)